MQYVHDYIEQLMAQGKADPKIRGWAMSDILTKVVKKFGYHKREDARSYIMSKCGVTDDE